MKFTREFLEELWTPDIVLDQMLEKRRWYSIHRVIFKHEGKFYETKPRVPASELQEDQDRYDGEEIECPEVVPYEKTVTDYMEVPQP